uniref:GAGE domain-containing protein n=1 Tax=Capra hircus TaxID=9925 RepID=A0A8C2PK83_CAPHI
MSARVRSRSRGRGDGQESSDTAETVAARKLGGKKSQRKEPPAKNVEVEPGQEKEGGASVVQGKGHGRTICISFMMFY